MYNLSVKIGNFGDGRQIAQERAQILELKAQECLEFDVCVCVLVLKTLKRKSLNI